MAEMKNICGKILLDLHEKFRQEIEETQSSTQRFIQQVIEEHFSRGEMGMEKRTLAVQVSEELFVRLKTLIAGKRGGFSDARGTLFFEIARILRDKHLRMFYLKMFPDYCRMTKGGRFVPSSVRFMNWGIMWNGRCLTARISGSRRQESGCILSDILTEDVPEKYFLSQKQMEQLLYKSTEAAKGNGSTIRRG